MKSLQPLILLIAMQMINTCFGQNSISVRVSNIWSNVSVKDNWTPSSAPGYKQYLDGQTNGFAFDLYYTFRPAAIIKNKNVFMNAGIGYFYQRYDVKRPFDYNSKAELIFRTDHYSYLCFSGGVGLAYRHIFPDSRYSLVFNSTYRFFKSFQQNYSPTFNTGTEGFFTQINRHPMTFGRMLYLSIELHRCLGQQFSIAIAAIVPVYTQWRNDEIFRDNPNTFHNPKFSLGASIGLSYYFSQRKTF